MSTASAPSLTATIGLCLLSAALAAGCAAQREEQRTNPPLHQDAVHVGGTSTANPSVPPPTSNQENTAVAVLPAQAPAREQREEKLSRDASGRVANELAVASHYVHACCPPPAAVDTERYQMYSDNPVHVVAEQPMSTFSIDVDTGSYANVRRFLNGGQLPPQDAVRVEEMLNYFDYAYAAPTSRETPFAVTTELGAAPWNSAVRLLRIGIQGYSLPAEQRPPVNLVFLIDVSGSMQSPDKLPLLKSAFRLLTQQLTGKDRVAMVVYAGASGVVLESTAGDRKQKILSALAELEAGGSTNGAAGIELAYRVARENHMRDGINRVILATDGDFNVGTVDFAALKDMAEREKTAGVALTTLGFGTGNYNDQLLEQLADAGDGNYAYVDTLAEARKVLVEELSSTLVTIARDVKIQVEFNPAQVLEYRLIGYENRTLAREDFNNDQVDAGDIGAGHRVTALYELVPAGTRGRVDPLRYGSQGRPGNEGAERSAPYAGELAHVRLRYKMPGSESSRLIEQPIAARRTAEVSDDFRFAASVAAFGQKLRGGKYLQGYGYDDIRMLASSATGRDGSGYRREFLALVDLASALDTRVVDPVRIDDSRD